jgi:hypothetical protein
MSVEPPCRTLAEYVGELIRRLGAADPPALERMRAVVDGRRARIVLDEEAVDVRFAREGLLVEPAGPGPTDGTGVTDRATTLELMDGYLEVTDAILDGRLDVTGTVDDVERMFLAIEILLDVAARTPALQELAADYRADPCREPRRSPPPPPPAVTSAESERALLDRLGLLPGPPG